MSGFAIGVVAISVVLVIYALIKSAMKTDPNAWYGMMACGGCGYTWRSRRNTPPASCPRCNTKRIEAVLGVR